MRISYHCRECGTEAPDGNNLCHPSAIVDSIVQAAKPQGEQQVKLYDIVGRCALAASLEAYKQAREDKILDPSLPFDTLEWYEKYGVKMGGLMWIYGKWC